MHRSTKREKQTHAMTFQKKTHDGLTLPAGQYYIGDLSSFLPKTLYSGLTEFGTYVAAETGDHFYITATGVSDGIFAASTKATYDVSDGNIGVCAVNLADWSAYTGAGSIHNFVSPLQITMDDGILGIQSGDWMLQIDTNTDIYAGSEDEGYDSYS